MKCYMIGLACVVAIVSSVFGADFEFALDSRTYANSLTLAPATTSDRAVLAIEKQIDAKRAADASRSSLQPFWDAPFWSSPLMKLIPIPLGPNRYAEDPYLIPEYLTVSWQQSEYQLRISDEQAHVLFGN